MASSSSFAPLSSDHNGNTITLMLFSNPSSLDDSQPGNLILRIKLLLCWFSYSAGCNNSSSSSRSDISSFRRISKVDCLVICPDGLSQSSTYFSSTIAYGTILALLNYIPHATGDFREAFLHHGEELRLYAQEALQSALNANHGAGIDLVFMGRLIPASRGLNPGEDVPELISYWERAILWGAYRLVKGKYVEKGCSICLEDFEPDALALRLPCGHVFHVCCLFRSLKSSKCCPMCRDDLAEIFLISRQKLVFHL